MFSNPVRAPIPSLSLPLLLQISFINNQTIKSLIKTSDLQPASPRNDFHIPVSRFCFNKTCLFTASGNSNQDVELNRFFLSCSENFQHSSLLCDKRKLQLLLLLLFLIVREEFVRLSVSECLPQGLTTFHCFQRLAPGIYSAPKIQDVYSH